MSLLGKRRSLVLAVSAVLILSAGAYAYWTAGGAGTGSGAAGTTTALTVTQTTVLTAMYPGDIGADDQRQVQQHELRPDPRRHGHRCDQQRHEGRRRGRGHL